LLQTIEAVASRINPRLQLSGVVLCMYEATRLAAEVTGEVESFFAAQNGPHRPWSDARVMQTRIRRNIRLAEAPSHGQSIFHYDATSSGAADYRQLVREVLDQCGLGLQTCPESAEYLAKSA
jgi:chromosome partitioning protein